MQVPKRLVDRAFFYRKPGTDEIEYRFTPVNALHDLKSSWKYFVGKRIEYLWN